MLTDLSAKETESWSLGVLPETGGSATGLSATDARAKPQPVMTYRWAWRGAESIVKRRTASNLLFASHRGSPPAGFFFVITGPRLPGACSAKPMRPCAAETIWPIPRLARWSGSISRVGRFWTVDHRRLHALILGLRLYLHGTPAKGAGHHFSPAGTATVIGVTSRDPV